MKNQIKKWTKRFVIAFLLINLGLTTYTTYAADDEANPADAPQSMGEIDPRMAPSGQLLEVGGSTGLPDFNLGSGQHPDAPADAEYAGAGTIGSVIYFLLDLFKYLMSGVAIVMIIVYAIRFIVQGSNEEDIKKVQKGLGVSIAGLIVIQLADILVKQVFFGDYGEVLEDKTSAQMFAEAGSDQIRGIIGFIQFGLGAIAVLMIIINGLRIMVTGMNEEGRKKALKNIGFAVGGLILIALSEVVVRAFVFPDQGDSLPSVDAGQSLIMMLTNFISGFVAVLSFVMLLYAGYLYVVAGTDDTTKDKVKKILTGAIIGIVLSLSAYAITNTLVRFEEPNEYIPAGENIVN